MQFLVVFAAAVWAVPAICQVQNFDALAGIKKAVRTPGHSSRDVASEVTRLFGDVNSEPLSSLRDLLATEHDDWQAKRKPPLVETRLVVSLNAHLDLNSSPDYLKIHSSELRRMRVFLWTQIPDLNGDFGSRKLSQGDSVLTSEIPPFEAFLSAGLLIYQKMLNSSYLQTDDERRVDAFGLIPAQVARSAQPPGTYSMEKIPAALQARQQEFQGKVRGFFLRNWLSGSTADEVTKIFGESRQ